MMSPGRGWNDRLREQSDSEDERNAPNPPSGFEDFTPISLGNNTAAISSGGVRRNSASTAAPAVAGAAARDSRHHHRVSSNFFGTHASQDLPGIELAPDSAAPQQNNTTSVPPVARPSGNKRRMSLHVRKASKAEAAQLAADEIKWEAEERHKLEQVAPIRGLAKQMSRMDIRRKPSVLGQPHHRTPDSGSDLPGIGSWLSGHSRRQSRADAAAAAAAAAATATTAATGTTTATGFVMPPVPPEPLVSENPGRMEAGYRPGHNESVHGRGAEGAGNPDTPPPLRNVQRRTSLLHHEPTEEAPPEETDQELMIGEIRNIHLDVEIALARKALVIIALSYVAAYVLRIFAGRLSKEVNVLLIVCFVSTLLLSFPFIRFTARLFAYVVTTWAPGLLYRGNRYYFVVALHYDIAIVIWSILSVIVWHQLYFSWVYPKESYSARVVFRYGAPILQCHLALRVGILVKNFLVLLVATSYLWRPYLQRVQSSILAQYILLLLTDYSIKGACNPDDQNFALEMVRQGSQNKKNISLYAVSKAMGFIPRHKLEHSFFRHLAGSDTLDSSKDATIIGNYLFEKLILRSQPKLSPAVTATPRRSLGLTSLTVNGGGGLAGFRKQSASFKTMRESSRRKFSRPGLHKRHSEPNTAIRPVMSSATSLDSEDDRIATVGGGREGGSDGGGGSRGRRGGDGGRSRIRSRSVGHDISGSSSGSGDEDGSSVPIINLVSNKVASGFNKLLTAGERAFSSNTSGGAAGGSSGSSSGVSSRESSTGPVPADSDKGVDESAAAAAGDEAKEEHSAKGDGQVSSIPEGDEGDAREASGKDAGGKDKDGVKEVVKASPEVRRASTVEEEEEGETEPEEVLVRATLCPLLHEELIKVAFKLFDADTSGTVTREEMVMGVVRAFKDHRSLSRTLQDSEHIARKLGLIIMGVILFILMFVWLSIWGADVVSLSVTFASFLIAFSFMIGAAASNLVSSVLFIFVSRIYDVGDRVHIYDGALGTTPTDVTVAKVDLMTTVFKRWDEQVFYMPNHLLATKTIVNIQRTAHQWHEFFIQVSASTPSDKLKALQASLQSFCKKKDKPDGLYPRMSFTLTAVENSNKLIIRVTFRQRGNWQQMEKKWACQSMCAWAIKNACGSLGIKYSMPEVPLVVRKEKTV